MMMMKQALKITFSLSKYKLEFSSIFPNFCFKNRKRKREIFFLSVFTYLYTAISIKHPSRLNWKLFAIKVIEIDENLRQIFVNLFNVH
jgi:hypothetical protein